ncbi:MAG: RNA-binding cell elongation regulator Jag/EloR [Acidimicrobiales bacterium]
MEWVETTGKNLEEARAEALKQLGVAEEDAEIDVLSEAKSGLFGRMRVEARVRARVRPTQPRAKEGRRDRRRRSLPERPENRSASNGVRATSTADEREATVVMDQEDGRDLARVGVPSGRSAQAGPGASSAATGLGRTPNPGAASGRETAPEPEAGGPDGLVGDVSLAVQGEVAQAFLTGLLERFGLVGRVEVIEVDDETIELAVNGDDLALLIGPKGTTVSALQDLARTVVQRRTGARHGRLLVDVAGYRQRRRVALDRFTRRIAEEVLASGEEQVLEPMTPADRKVVHDTVNQIPGLATRSDGEDPYRRVTLLPEA